MLGVFTGRWLGTARPLHERLSGLFAAGALATMLGLMWNWWFPINKALWTSSYVLFTGGVAATALAVILWMTDARGLTRWTRFFVIYGTNPLVTFVGSGVMAKTIGALLRVRYGGAEMSLQEAVYQGLFAGWLEPRNASLAYAVCFVLVWFAILAILHRRGLVLKV